MHTQTGYEAICKVCGERTGAALVELQTAKLISDHIAAHHPELIRSILLGTEEIETFVMMEELTLVPLDAEMIELLAENSVQN